VKPQANENAGKAPPKPLVQKSQGSGWNATLPWVLAAIVFSACFYVLFFGNPFHSNASNSFLFASATPSPTPAHRGLLEGATFYTGPRPAPALVSYYADSGNNTTVLALPGQLIVHAPANATRQEVEKVLSASPVKYQLLGAIPSVGIYHIGVSSGREALFIASLRVMHADYGAVPNMVLGTREAPAVDLSNITTGIVDMTDSRVPTCGEMFYVPAFLGSPDPDAMAIAAVIDSFHRTNESEPSHGENTAAALKSSCNNCPLLKLDLGSDSVSFDQIQRAMVSAIAGAEINGQDIVVSLSFGPAPKFNAANQQDYYYYTNDVLRNQISGDIWESCMKSMLDVLAGSSWAQSGHVRFHKSADNGALLCNPPSTGETWCSNSSKIVDNKGINLTDSMQRLLGDPVYGPIMRNEVFVWCAYDHGKTTIASYSNFGAGIDCLDPYGGLDGTSFSAPLGAGYDYLSLKERLGRGPPTPTLFPSVTPTCPANVTVTLVPTIVPTLSPARDLTGRWVGTATFTEDNIYAGVASGEVLCSWTGTFTFDLIQEGNTIVGYYNKGVAKNWSYFTFKVTGFEKKIISQNGTVPPAGCYVPSGGIVDFGIDSGIVSSTAIYLDANGKQAFSGAFTTDQMSLSLTNCLLQAGDSCTVVDKAKWKITLVRQQK